MRISKECITIHCCYDILCTALFKALFHVPLLYFEHLPLQRSLHGPAEYDIVMSAILRAYELAPEAYRQIFWNNFKPEKCHILSLLER